LNRSYTATYCAHPSIFGTEHLRLADPAQLADIIGQDGFTIVLLQVKERNENGQDVVEVVATGSVKNFGNGDVKQYAQWSRNVSGTQWMTARAEAAKKTSDSGVNVAPHEMLDKFQDDVRMEITAFAVSPEYQGMGLGARVLEDIEWLVSGYVLPTSSGTVGIADSIEIANAWPFEGAYLPSTPAGQWSQINGIDLDKFKKSYQQVTEDVHKLKEVALDSDVHRKKKPKLVLMGIRELGNETYYERRGYKSIWAGIVPVGMWDCREECTMVYMEKEL